MQKSNKKNCLCKFEKRQREKESRKWELDIWKQIKLDNEIEDPPLDLPPPKRLLGPYGGHTLEGNVLKTRSNRLVQPVGPGTEYESGWVNLSKSLMGQIEVKPEKSSRTIRTKEPEPIL